jgi:hypothetical protein
VTHKLTTKFFEDFYATWQEHGAKALKKMAESSPRDFVRAAALLMPKEFEIKKPFKDLTDAQLAELLLTIDALIARGITLEGTKPSDGQRRRASAAAPLC